MGKFQIARYLYFWVDFYDVDLLAFGFGILNCVPSAARLLAIPNGKDCVGVVYHIIVPHEHAGAEVVVIDHCDLVRFFEYFFITGGFGGRPFQGLIRTGDSTFQLDVKVIVLPKLNDGFGKVYIDAESHTSNKMVEKQEELWYNKITTNRNLWVICFE